MDNDAIEEIVDQETETAPTASFSFLKDLHEARMTRDSNNAVKFTYTDCCERVYLSLLCLELMRQHSGFVQSARKYAKRTSDKHNYNVYSMFATDLYNFIYFVTGDEDAMNKLKDPEAAKKARKQTTMPVMVVNRYLHQLANDAQPSQVASMFLKLEFALKITNSDYLNIRRVITNLRKTNTADRERYITRLAFAARAKLRSADIIEDFEKCIASNDYEIDRVNDPEPTASVPDLPGSTGSLQLYRYLVGTENLMMAKKFMDIAKNGASVPSQYVQGYLPIVKMIDDIVQAGPSYIQQLRVVHQRAKKSRK